MSILPDHLDPTLHDDTTAKSDVVECGRCGERVDRENECEYTGIVHEHPRCAGCCDCEDCAGNATSFLHDPSTRSDAAA